MVPQQIQILMICLLCVICIVAYGTFRCKQPNFQDPFTKSMLPAPWSNFLDGWGILHVFFFMGLAYAYPRHLLFIFVAGVVWELVEFILKDRPFYISKCNVAPVIDTNGVQKVWWYGRWEDIVMNSIGIAIGYTLASL